MTPVPTTVTDAGGFIGRALCRHLAAGGRHVVGLDVDARARGRVEAAGPSSGSPTSRTPLRRAPRCTAPAASSTPPPSSPRLRAMRARRLVLPGRGERVMTPVHIDDLVEAALLALDAPGGRAYTVWDGRPVPARDFFAFHARWLGRRRVPTAPRPLVLAGARLMEVAGRGEVSREALMYVSRRATYPNARARVELGWTPRVDLEAGMQRTESWLRASGRL